MNKTRNHDTESYTMVDDSIDASVKSLDPAFHAGQTPELTKDTESLDMSPLEPQVPSSVAHRRGRRKVMKKKMLKDEEGYLGERDNVYRSHLDKI